ncbi:MAG: pentapeptide repeat-containing protein [Rhizonema sp. PD38]|nr:pentapeptide repeat-containing protein [Rhizonema sp. PD38]
MANKEHLAILKQGVEVWNEWRKKNRTIIPDLTEVNFNGMSFRKVDFSRAILTKANLCKTYLREANLNQAILIEANLTEVNLTAAKLRSADLSRSILHCSNLDRANLSGANITEANLYKANLYRANFKGVNLSKANLYKANLTQAQLLATNCTKATFTEACLQDWNINSATRLDEVVCDYVYLRFKKQERRPPSGSFAPGEFTRLFQKSLETVDLIFRNGVDWDAFAYSFKKVEVENQDAQLDVQSIEKKGDGILVVKVNVSPNADKAKIHSDFMQGYEFAHKALEAQYQARLEDKDKEINRLFYLVNQQSETSKKVSTYYFYNPQIAGGIVDANTVHSQHIGGNIQSTDNQD